MPSRTLVSLVWCVLAAFCEAGAEDWPGFRGPTGQGLSKSANLPLEWSATTNIAWKQTIPGKGWSSPVLVNGRLYLTTATAPENGGGSTLTLHALCLNEKDGATIWDKPLIDIDPGSAPRGHAKNSQASATPLIEGDRFYAHFGHLGTACLNLNGEVLWKNTNIHYPPVHGNGGSPVIVDDALIFSCDGASNPFVVALDKRTGKELWRTARSTTAAKRFSFSTPLVIEVKGKKQVISPASGGVSAYEPRTGKELWRVRYGEGYSVVPRPVFGNGLLFLSSGFDRPIVMAIRPDGSGDVTDTHVAWKLAKGGPTTPSLLLVGDELYFVSDNGVASCVEAATGKVHWQERLGGNYSASPIHAGGRIYFQSEEGTAVIVKAAKSFEKLATNELGERSLASLAVGNDALFIRTEKHLFKVQ